MLNLFETYLLTTESQRQQFWSLPTMSVSTFLFTLPVAEVHVVASWFQFYGQKPQLVVRQKKQISPRLVSQLWLPYPAPKRKNANGNELRSKAPAKST